MRLTLKTNHILYKFILLVALTPLSALAEWKRVETVNQFEEVAFTRSEHNSLVSDTNSAEFWGVVGPQSVFRAWNSAAFDQENGLLYFFGGGHADYGGNEIYRYDINQREWRRITAPAPLINEVPHSNDPNKTVFIPASTPLSSHSYDGITWNPHTKSIWFASAIGFGGVAMPPHTPANNALWEFNPATLEWTRHQSSLRFKYPRSTYLPDSNQLLFVDYMNHSNHRAALYDEQGNETFLGAISGFDSVSAVGTLFTNPQNGDIYSAHSEGIYKITLSDSGAHAEKVTTFPSIEALHMSLDYKQAAFNYRPQDGKFYIWGGSEKFITWDPESNQFEVIWNEGTGSSPADRSTGNGKVFSKFVYMTQEDKFLGTKNGDIWSWKPTPNPQNINHLTPSELLQDGSTPTSVSLFLPILFGDRNYNASVSVFYQQASDDEWQRGINLHRIRPEFSRNSKNATGKSGEGFAGIIDNLAPATHYRIKAIISDPDAESDSEQLLDVHTPSAPINVRRPPTISVSNTQELKQALNSATPGDVIDITPGLYTGPFTITRGGTNTNPVVIQGIWQSSAILDGDGKSHVLRVDTDNVHLLGLKLQNAEYGVIFGAKTRGVSIQKNHITDVKVGINAKRGQRDLYIANNILEGSVAAGDTSSDTWNFEGIVVTGENIEVAHNTLSGFGDSLGMHWFTDLPNKSIVMHHNLVKWGGDDGIEFDFALRNVSAHRNAILNSANGLSFQPVWGGPVYAHKNLVLNAGRGPLKIKPEQDNPSGINIYHNTFVRYPSDIQYGGKQAWSNASGHIKKLRIINNLFVSASNQDGEVLTNSSSHSLTEINHNAWTSDGKFRFNLSSRKYGVSKGSFQGWLQNGFVGAEDILVDSTTLYQGINLRVEQLTFADIPYLTPPELVLAGDSGVIDAGRVIAGVNQGYVGAGPDIGHLEWGEVAPQYGAVLTIEEPDRPIAIDDYITTTVGTPVTLNPQLNDIIPHGFAVTLSVSDTASVGTEVSDSGEVTLTPAADFIGNVSLNYQLLSPNQPTSEARIHLRVTPPNRAPLPADDRFDVTEGENIIISKQALLSNDSDPDNDELSFDGYTSPNKGEIVPSTDHLNYFADIGSTGEAQFSYWVTDSNGGRQSATVHIKIIPAGAIIGTEYRDIIDLTDAGTGYQTYGNNGYEIYGNGGPDIIHGSPGDDIIVGGHHEDRMAGYDGDDTFLYTGDNYHSDWIDGGSGFNVIQGNEQDNIIGLYEVTNIARIDGGDGYDIIRGTRYRQIYDFREVELISIELIDGGSHSDIITGSIGDDTFLGGCDGDQLDGYSGNDTVIYTDASIDYRVEELGDNRIGVICNGDEDNMDILTSIETLELPEPNL